MDVFDHSDEFLDEEDEQTLAAIDRAVKSADEGRLVTAEEARRRLGLPPKFMIEK